MFSSVRFDDFCLISNECMKMGQNQYSHIHSTHLWSEFTLKLFGFQIAIFFAVCFSHSFRPQISGGNNDEYGKEKWEKWF